MKRLIFSLVMLSVGASYGQNIRGPIASPAPGVLDGVYVKEHIPTKKVVPYEYVREADVTWSKRVWSVIDLREKFNHPLYYPLDDINVLGAWNKNTTRWSLWTIIRYHVLWGDLTIYSPYDPEWQDYKDGDQFKYPIIVKDPLVPVPNYYNSDVFKQAVFLYLGSIYRDPAAVPLKSWQYPADDSVIYDPATGNYDAVYPPDDTTWYNSDEIVQYRLKEDWFFDKERSVMDRRIIGIAPVIYERDDAGNIIGFEELFWLYFPECRYVFQNFFVQNRNNDSQRMSFDDLFWKRMFQSYIIKESNLYDREIDSYKAGVDALLESEKIKEKIFNFEHDLWSF